MDLLASGKRPAVDDRCDDVFLAGLCVAHRDGELVAHRAHVCKLLAENHRRESRRDALELRRLDGRRPRLCRRHLALAVLRCARRNERAHLRCPLGRHRVHARHRSPVRHPGDLQLADREAALLPALELVIRPLVHLPVGFLDRDRERAPGREVEAEPRARRRRKRLRKLHERRVFPRHADCLVRLHAPAAADTAEDDRVGVVLQSRVHLLDHSLVARVALRLDAREPLRQRLGDDRARAEDNRLPASILAHGVDRGERRGEGVVSRGGTVFALDDASALWNAHDAQEVVVEVANPRRLQCAARAVRSFDNRLRKMPDDMPCEPVHQRELEDALRLCVAAEDDHVLIPHVVDFDDLARQKPDAREPHGRQEVYLRLAEADPRRLDGALVRRDHHQVPERPPGRRRDLAPGARLVGGRTVAEGRSVKLAPSSDAGNGDAVDEIEHQSPPRRLHLAAVHQDARVPVLDEDLVRRDSLCRHAPCNAPVDASPHADLLEVRELAVERLQGYALVAKRLEARRDLGGAALLVCRAVENLEGVDERESPLRLVGRQQLQELVDLHLGDDEWLFHDAPFSLSCELVSCEWVS